MSLEYVIPDGSDVSLDITRSGNDAVIDWSGAGTLQSADAPGGPWTSLPVDLDTPFIFQLTVPRKFFRETE